MTGHAEPDRNRGTPRRALLRGLAVLLALPLLRVSGFAPLAVAGRAAASPPDFSAVTSRAIAYKLVSEGRLVEIALFPLELGGPDEPHNLSYITPEAAYVRALVIGTFGRFFDEDVIDRLEIEPEYKGPSVVPRRIRMDAHHSGQGGSIGTVIDVW
jgi:hypothetical protein